MTETHIEQHLELHLPVTEPMLALELLANHCELSKQQLKSAMQKGAVWVTPCHGSSQHAQRLRRAKKMLKTGDCLHLYFDREILDHVVTPSELVADFGDYSIWNKPCGIYSQGSKWGDHCTIGRWSEQHLKPERPAFVVHRLDRATSGLILLAHSKRVARALSRLFAERRIEKCYRAVVHGEFPADRQSIKTPIDERHACSHVEVLQYFPERGLSLVEVQIETGRKHQIRRHLAALGFPIIGDRLHGIENNVTTGWDLQLCAYRLQFTCPINDELRVVELDAEQCPWVGHFIQRREGHPLPYGH